MIFPGVLSFFQVFQYSGSPATLLTKNRLDSHPLILSRHLIMKITAHYYVINLSHTTSVVFQFGYANNILISVDYCRY